MEGSNNPQALSLMDVEMYRATLSAGSLYPGGDVPILPEEMARENTAAFALPSPDRLNQRTQQPPSYLAICTFFEVKCAVFPCLRQEQELTIEDREEKAFTCLVLAQKHMQSHRDVYKQVIQEKSPELGMRQDDILVALVHSMWASCYNTSMSMDSNALSSLSPKETAALLTPQTTNTRFSQQMLQQLDRAIEQLSVSRTPDFATRAQPRCSLLLRCLCFLQVENPPQISQSSAPAGLVIFLPFLLFGIIVFALLHFFKGPGEPETEGRLSDEDPGSAVSTEAILKDVDSSEAAPRRRVSEGPVRGPALRCAREGPLRAS
ncbi:hypothetical protein Emag_003468 [Eimeria magna]